MNDLAVPRKKRNLPIILASRDAFSDAVRNRDSARAARIVFNTTIDVLGVNGLLEALDRGSAYWQRRHSSV